MKNYSDQRISRKKLNEKAWQDIKSQISLGQLLYPEPGCKLTDYSLQLFSLIRGRSVVLNDCGQIHRGEEIRDDGLDAVTGPIRAIIGFAITVVATYDENTPGP